MTKAPDAPHPSTRHMFTCQLPEFPIYTIETRPNYPGQQDAQRITVTAGTTQTPTLPDQYDTTVSIQCHKDSSWDRTKYGQSHGLYVSLLPHIHRTGHLHTAYNLGDQPARVRRVGSSAGMEKREIHTRVLLAKPSRKETV